MMFFSCHVLGFAKGTLKYAVASQKDSWVSGDVSRIRGVTNDVLLLPCIGFHQKKLVKRSGESKEQLGQWGRFTYTRRQKDPCSMKVYCGQKKSGHSKLKIPDSVLTPFRKYVSLFLAGVYIRHPNDSSCRFLLISVEKSVCGRVE